MRFARAVLLVLAVLSLAAAARATTVVPVSDDDLALSSDAIVEGRCLRVESAIDGSDSAVYQFVTFDVRRVVKGDVAPGRIVLKQIGGVTPQAATVVWGAPYWQPNWDMLLYLTVGPDGSLRVAHLSQGYFRIIHAADGSRFVSRPVAGPNVHVLGGGARGPVTDVAPFDDYVARLEALLAEHPEARSRRAFVAVPRDAPRAAASDKRETGAPAFRFLGTGFRWSEPDAGGSIHFRVRSDDAPTASGGLDEARAAAEAWSTVAGSEMRVAIDGKTSSCGVVRDGTSSISFGDCAGALDDPVNCTGVVAFGAVTAADPSQTIDVAGKTFARIQESDIIFNRGFECLFEGDPAVVAEVMTHEMGHTLGFGHSSERIDEPDATLASATMFFATHDDERGASLRDDDSAAARTLYRARVTGDPPAIRTTALPDAGIGASYGVDLAATGSGPLTWSIASGALPAGLALSASGRISGTSESEELATVTVRVRDAANFDASRTLQLRSTASPSPFVASASFKGGKKLVVAGSGFTATAKISVNGVAIVPPRTAKLKASKGQLLVAGAPGDLNIRTGVPNVVVVEVDGRASNGLEF